MYLPVNRHWSKLIGGSLMVLGFLLATPPGMILPDDWINIIVAGFVVKMLGVSMPVALLLTYTVIAWSVFIAGALVFPYNTAILIKAKFNQLKSLIIRIVTDPRLLVVTLVMFAVIWLAAGWYMSYIVAQLM